MRNDNFSKPGNELLRDCYGVVACGGKSSRMHTDKSMLTYFDKPQCYHLYEMLRHFCEKVFISCNDEQLGKINAGYLTNPDLAKYKNTGPIACILSIFEKYPGKDIIVLGCDYPFLTAEDISNFLHSFDRRRTAAAFYNSKAGCYEPLLAYYNYDSANELYKMFLNKEFSLQHFLTTVNAEKFYCPNEKAIESVDTQEDYVKASILIQKNG